MGKFYCRSYHGQGILFNEGTVGPQGDDAGVVAKPTEHRTRRSDASECTPGHPGAGRFYRQQLAIIKRGAEGREQNF